MTVMRSFIAGDLFEITDEDVFNNEMFCKMYAKLKKINSLNAEVVNGFLTQFVIARHFDFRAPELFNLHDDGVDYKIGDVKIDIKSTLFKKNNPRLFVTYSSKLKADYYLLFQNIGKKYIKFVGCASADKIKEINRVQQLKYKKCYIINFEELNKNLVL